MTDKKTLEDALAEMEASNAKAAELRAKQAPELIAEAVKRTALNARLAALPQMQRRQVLDAAGLNNVSAAPAPITPLKASSYTQPRTPVALPAIDWRYWRHMPEVKQWEACALSMNINPDNMKPHPQSWMAGPGSGPLFTPASFPNGTAQTEFDKRLRLLGASLFKSGFFTAVNKLVVGGRHLATITLQEFAAWGLHVELDMPTELVAMGEPSQASKKNAPYADALEPSEYQNSQEYQAQYARAGEALDRIPVVEREIREWESARAATVTDKKDKEQKLAALKMELAGLQSLVNPGQSRQRAIKPQPAPVDAESASGGVEQAPDPERRLALLRVLGGSAKYTRGEWKFTGTGALVAREKADSRSRSDEKTIRADLKEAAQAERDAKAAGVFNGLGQR